MSDATIPTNQYLASSSMDQGRVSLCYIATFSFNPQNLRVAARDKWRTSVKNGRSMTRAIMVAAALALAATFAAESGGNPPPGTLVSINYHSWNEVIEIDARRGRIVDRETRFEYESDVSDTPKSSKTVTPLDAPVTKDQIKQLTDLVTHSGVMQLAASYGAPEGQRSYPYEIDITFEGEPTKIVKYRSNPSFEAEPEAFTKVVAYLHDLCRSFEKEK